MQELLCPPLTLPHSLPILSYFLRHHGLKLATSVSRNLLSEYSKRTPTLSLGAMRAFEPRDLEPQSKQRNGPILMSCFVIVFVTKMVLHLYSSVPAEYRISGRTLKTLGR